MSCHLPPLKHKILIISLPILSLNWRQAPPTSQIISKIEGLFTELDSQQVVSLRLSSTTAKDAVVFGEKDGVRLFLRVSWLMLMLSCISSCNNVLQFHPDQCAHAVTVKYAYWKHILVAWAPFWHEWSMLSIFHDDAGRNNDSSEVYSR